MRRGFAFYKMKYSEQLKHPKWQKKRLEILKRDKWKCKKCKDDTTTLNVHHKEYLCAFMKKIMN